MHLKFVLIIIVLGFIGRLEAQNGNFSSLSMFDQMYYNPGYAGEGNDIEARILNRNQWMGFEGAPNTFTLNVDAPFKLLGQHHGAGISLVRDVVGNFSNNEINISYAYRKSLIQGELGIGIGLNMISHDYDVSNWLFPNGDTKSEDGLVPSVADQRPLLFDANIGVFYRGDNLFLSVSCRNLSNTKVKYLNESGDTGSETTSTPQKLVGKQVYFNTGYDYQLPNPMYSVQPGVFLGTDFTSTQLSLSGTVTYNKRIFGGLAYKPTDAIIFMFGFDLPSGMHAAVSYDVTTSRIIKYSTGSFEFMVGYKFSLDIDKDNRKYKSVRFL